MLAGTGGIYTTVWWESLHWSIVSGFSSCPGAPAVIPMCRTWRKDCCFVLNVLVSPAGTPGRCWAWWLGTNLRAPCVGVWLLSQFATETPVPCWSEVLQWVLGVPCERAASMSGSSEAPGRPDPWLPAHHLLSLWRMLSTTFHDLTGSPCAGTVEGGPVHLLQDQTHTQTHTQLECQATWKANPTGSQICLQCPPFWRLPLLFYSAPFLDSYWTWLHILNQQFR